MSKLQTQTTNGKFKLDMLTTSKLAGLWKDSRKMDYKYKPSGSLLKINLWKNRV